MTLMLDRDPALAHSTVDTDRGQAAFTSTGLALYDLLILRGLSFALPRHRFNGRGRLHKTSNR
jgi:hypothetical protein